MKDLPFQDVLLTMPRLELEAMVNNWLWEIPLEETPTEEQVLKMIEFIQKRPDVADCEDVITNCNEYLSKKDFYDPLDSPAIRWEKAHGGDPDKWPQPTGQPLTWREWAHELSAESMRQSFQPSPGFFPWDEAAIQWAADTCWLDDWVLGKTPSQVIKEQSGE